MVPYKLTSGCTWLGAWVYRRNICLFYCDLFNNTVSSLDCIESNDRMIMS
jgi:hypothetical protein